MYAGWAVSGALTAGFAVADAAWQLLWNNPKIHTPERRKTWLACPEHRAWLEDYLQTRGLWKATVPLDDAAGNGAESPIVPGRAG